MATKYSFFDKYKLEFNYDDNKKKKKSLDPDSVFLDERPHVIIYIDQFGELSYEYTQHQFLDPFSFDKNIDFTANDESAKPLFAPKFFIRFSESPKGVKENSAEKLIFDISKRNWDDIFMSHNKDEIRLDLKSKYFPGLAESVNDKQKPQQ